MKSIGKLLLCVALELLQTSYGHSMQIADSGDNVVNTSSQLPPQFDDSLSVELNCSGSNVSYNTYTDDFLQLSIGMYVLKQYSSKVYGNRNSEYPTSVDCSSPVEYTGVYYPHHIPRMQDIASWFSVFLSFSEYMESLSETGITEDDINVLGNITTLLNSVLRDYYDVVRYSQLLIWLTIRYIDLFPLRQLQDVKCNCSSACVVVPVATTPPFLCSDEITSLYHHLYKAVQRAYATLGSYQRLSLTKSQIDGWIRLHNVVFA